MTKHKAPWRVETNSMGRVVTVCSADGWPIARMVEDTDKDSAALIAAAPDLLDALKVMVRDMQAVNAGGQYGIELEPAIYQAHKAIAKAEGSNG